jgi:FdhD protein
MNDMAAFPLSDSGIVATLAERIAGGVKRDAVECQVVQEEVLTIEVEDIGSYALMWTPTTPNPGAVAYTTEDGVLAEEGVPEALALAAGFIFSEGMVASLADIAAMWICADRPDVVRIRLQHPEKAAVERRNVVVNSSCGVCGGREQLMSRPARAASAQGELRLSVVDLAAIRTELQSRQSIFPRTGGTHGAALFGPDLKILATAEDIGRHNALDKVIGYRLLSGQSFAACGAFISSRISYEMAAKAVRAGLDVLAAISAPSSLAIDLARQHGLTLCGFVRGETATVYTHPQRIVL